ncbi:MAG TPA: hypothetical protein VN493_05050 [Thermoanaerobaculia bacterium]|nr:hypothetical protein [Thermoanaerobaculia bacterium]
MLQGKDNQGEAGFVDSGILSAFVARVAELHRQDLLSSTLFGQLAADKLFSRMTQPEEWCQKYFETIEKVGWQIGSFRFNHVRPVSATFTVEEMALALLETKVTPAEIELARKTMRSLRELPEKDPRVVVFNGSSHSTNAVNVQISVRTPSVMVSAGLAFTTRQEVKRTLGEELLTAQLEGDILDFVQVGKLNEAVYSKVRESVIEKLGPRRKELILQLDIASSDS